MTGPGTLGYGGDSGNISRSMGYDDHQRTFSSPTSYHATPPTPCGFQVQHEEAGSGLLHHRRPTAASRPQHTQARVWHDPRFRQHRSEAPSAPFHGTMVYHPTTQAWYGHPPKDAYAQPHGLPVKVEDGHVNRAPASHHDHYTSLQSSATAYSEPSGFGSHPQLLPTQRAWNETGPTEAHSYPPVVASEQFHHAAGDSMAPPYVLNSQSDSYYSSLIAYEVIPAVTAERSRKDSIASLHTVRQSSIPVPPQKTDEFNPFSSSEFPQPHHRAHHSVLPSDQRRESVMAPAPYSGPLLSIPDSSRALTPTVTGCYLHTDADVLAVLQACLRVCTYVDSYVFKHQLTC